MKDAFDPELYDLYARTAYSVRDGEGKEIIFTIQEASNLPDLKGRRFAIVTAWNPMNKPLSRDENVKRNRELETCLRRTSYVFYPSLGVLGDHSEESFTVEEIPESEALELGSLFGQYAIVFSGEEGCRLIRCPLRGL